MAIDEISEIISHFIGFFTLTGTENRLRDETDGFNHTPNLKSEFDGHDPITLLLRAPYETLGHTPGVTPFWFSPPQASGLPHHDGLPNTHVPLVNLHFDAPDLSHEEMAIKLSAPLPFFTFEPLPPSSIAVITHQINVLSDNDLMWSDPTASYIPIAALEAQLDDLVAVSYALASTPTGDPLALAADAQDFFTTISSDYAALANMDVEGASIIVLTGGDAVGTTVNGVIVDEAPALSDLLPQYLQTEETETDEVNPSSIDVVGSAEISAELFGVEDGHAVVAGANLVINEAVLVSAPVDASVIAVTGDMVSLTAISQVNVVRDHDAGTVEPIAPTQTINAATVALESSVIEGATAEQTEELPSAWGVTRIEADLVLVNWMHQYNLISDHDVAQMTFSGEDTYINFGGNTTLNQVSLLELTMSYDLVIIGGHMIDMSLITQTNILLDDDTVSYNGDWPETLSGGDNLLFNSALVSTTGINSFTSLTDTFEDAGDALGQGGTTLSADVAQDDLFLGNASLSVLYIEGDFVNVTSVEQTNIVGDADQIAVELAALEDRPENPDGPVTVTTGSNAVVNIATILEYGMDSTIMVGGEVYDDVLLYQANLIDTDDDPVSSPIAPLATEAVAFLADDSIVSQSDSEPMFIAPTNDEGVSPDIMQSVLA